jgi:hypothetical protein
MRVEGSTPEPLWLRRLPNVSLPCGLEFFHGVGAKLLVEIGPEGWTPTQQPPELSFTQLGTAKGATSTCAKKEDAET